MAFKNIFLQINKASTSYYAESHYFESIGVDIVPECPYSPDLNFSNRFFFANFRDIAHQTQRRRGDDNLHKALLQISNII